MQALTVACNGDTVKFYGYYAIQIPVRHNPLVAESTAAQILTATLSHIINMS